MAKRAVELDRTRNAPNALAADHTCKRVAAAATPNTPPPAPAPEPRPPKRRAENEEHLSTQAGDAETTIARRQTLGWSDQHLAGPVQAQRRALKQLSKDPDLGTPESS